MSVSDISYHIHRTSWTSEAVVPCLIGVGPFISFIHVSSHNDSAGRASVERHSRDGNLISSSDALVKIGFISYLLKTYSASYLPSYSDDEYPA